MKDLQKFCVRDLRTLLDCVAVIQANKTRCAVVVNDASRVIGVFSEGDVLRAVMQGVDLHTPIRALVKPSFHYLFEPDLRRAYELFRKFAITLVPVVDKDFGLTDVITIFDLLGHLRFEDAATR